MSDDVNWRKYLAEFHRDRAGIAEAVLSRTLAGDHSPYRWLARAVSATATIVVDLACGSGPMSRELAQPGRTIVGLDLSEHELALASQRGPGPWVRADALQLPFKDASIDVVTSSMGLVVVQPLTRVIEEVARVLRPGGVLGRDRPRDSAARPERSEGPHADQRPAAYQAAVSGTSRADRICPNAAAAWDAGRRRCPRALSVWHSFSRRRGAGHVGVVSAEHAVVAGGACDRVSGGQRQEARGGRSGHPDAPTRGHQIGLGQIGLEPYRGRGAT